MAQAKAWHRRLAPCGSRNEAFKSFKRAVREVKDSTVVLWVDSEDPVIGTLGTHVTGREKWDVTEISNEILHLMIQTMETWIVSDPEAMSKYYGRGFRPNTIPASSKGPAVNIFSIESPMGFQPALAIQVVDGRKEAECT